MVLFWLVVLPYLTTFRILFCSGKAKEKSFSIFKNSFYDSSWKYFVNIIFLWSWVSQKIFSIWVRVSLRCVYRVIEAVKSMGSTRFDLLCHCSWCADQLCIASVRVWFEDRISEGATFAVYSARCMEIPKRAWRHSHPSLISYLRLLLWHLWLLHPSRASVITCVKRRIVKSLTKQNDKI